MSEVNWQDLSVAVACSLEWERRCDRAKFLDENSFRRAVAEYLQSRTTAKIESEYNHPDIPGNTRLDLVGFGPQAKKIDFAVEAKWIKDGGGVRDWPAEITDDIFRLEMVTTDMAQQNERMLVVGGVASRVSTGLVNKGKNVAGQNRLRWLDELLPDTITGVDRRTAVWDCKVVMRPFFKARATSIGVTRLPISFQAQLVGHYQVDPNDNASVVSYVWQIRRSQNRRIRVPQ